MLSEIIIWTNEKNFYNKFLGHQTKQIKYGK